MICPPCRKAGFSRGYIRAQGWPLDTGRLDYLKSLHAACESPDCPCQHLIARK
jgi:hypothetical protein